MKNQYLFTIGTDPYKTAHGHNTEGNGDWHAKDSCVTEALKLIFNSMDFPGEAAGRKMFVPGVSLEGVPGDEVIQVWSNAPGIRKRTYDAMGWEGGPENCQAGLHDGNDNHFGLHVEIPVKDIEKYTIKISALLKAPDAEGDPGQGISPLAASVMRYQEQKHLIKEQVQIQKMEVARKQWEVSAMARDMENKVAKMKEQISVFDAYLHGTRHKTHLCRGKHATGRYKVFQQRVYLFEEVAILGNFQDMDFKGMNQFEKWLIESGHIWKLLPFERCILATRIRQKEKDYGDPFTNMWNNMANMQNIIWIRDGENVFHVDVEFNFHNAVFPHKDQFDRVKQIVLDHVWAKAFALDDTPPRERFTDRKLKEGEYDVMGQMRVTPLEEEEPYYTRRIKLDRFKTLQDWTDDPTAYTPELEAQIAEAIQEYLRNINKKQMIFAVIMQGIVDNTNYLEIPKGTDMFNWENVERYLELVIDYSHGLPFYGWRDKIAPYMDGKVSVGDWIVANVDEYYNSEERERWGLDGTKFKESYPMLFKVIGLGEGVTRRWFPDNAKKDHWKGEWRDVKDMCPVVKYHPFSSRRHPDDNWGVRRRRKQPMNMLLKNSKFLRVPMSPQLAKDILNDREWKKHNVWLVPYMVNYDTIIQAMKTPVNGTQLKWKLGDSE